jgi:CubicO group peptidase (beta-lactamase class C family)
MTLSRSLSQEIQWQLNALVEQGAARSLQLGLGWRDQSLGIWASGFEGLKDQGRRVSPQTWYDLASLTKMIVTSSLTLWTLQARKIESLDDSLEKHISFLGANIRGLSFRELLEHRAGFPAGWEPARHEESRESKIKAFWGEVDALPRQNGELYSDVGFLILGFCLEYLWEGRLRDLISSTLGLETELAFGPLRRRRWALVKRRSIASTLSLQSSTEELIGRVQDPRADWFEGDAGHAGLFGTARGVEAWAQKLYRAYHGKDTQWAEAIWRDQLDFQRPGRFLSGFDRPTAPSQSGSFFPPTTIGHLGYTGTSFWMDLESGWRVTLLGNRWAPGIDSEKLKILRPLFHDWLWHEVRSQLKA